MTLDEHGEHKHPGWVVAALNIIGWLGLAAGVLFAVVAVVASPDGGTYQDVGPIELDVDGFVVAIGSILGGITHWALFRALACIVDYLWTAQRELRRSSGAS